MGGVASGSVFGATQRLNKVSRIWSQQPAAAAGQRAYAAFSLDSRQGILWRFGGLSNDGVSLSTTVVASGPLPTRADTVLGCGTMHCSGFVRVLVWVYWAFMLSAALLNMWD